MTGRDAIQCLERSWKNVWANWELLLLYWMGQIAVGLFALAGLLAPVFVIGFDLAKSGWEIARSGGSFEEWLAMAGQRLLTPGWEWAVALLALLVFWGLAGLVYSFIQAGLVGTLDAGEAAADAAHRTDRPAFRVAAAATFFDRGRRHFWPFFGLVNLWGAVMLLGLLPLLLGLVVVLASGGEPSGAALVGVGCLGVLFSMLVMIASTLWYFVAQALLVRPGLGVVSASRQAFTVFFRRPWAILLLVVLWICAVMAVSVVLLPVSSAGTFMLPDDLFNVIVFQVALSLMQNVLNAIPQLLFLGSVVSLVRSEPVVARPVVVHPAEVSFP